MARGARRGADRRTGREPWRIHMSPVRCRLVPVLPILMVATTLSATAAFARDSEKQWEVGVYGVDSRYSNSANLKTAPGYGLRAGYHVKAIHEFELDYDKTSSDSVNLANVSYDIAKYVATYLRIFQPKGKEKLAPFVAFGLGRMGLDSRAGSESSTVYKAGGGVKYFFSPRVGIRFDALMWRWHGHGELVGRNPFYSFDAGLGGTYPFGGEK